MDRAELKRRLMGLPKEAAIDGFLECLIIDCGEVYREALTSARKAEEAKTREAREMASKYLQSWQGTRLDDDYEAFCQADRDGNRHFNRAQAYFNRLMDAYNE